MAEVRSPMVADVGARIRSLRTAKGMTQAQLAEPNYTKAYISMLESGRTRASMKALEHIAGVLGVKPADLLGGQRGRSAQAGVPRRRARAAHGRAARQSRRGSARESRPRRLLCAHVRVRGRRTPLPRGRPGLRGGDRARR